MAVVWPFEPESLRVKIESASSLLSGFSTEQRASYRPAMPRVVFTMGSLLEDPDTHLAQNLARRAGEVAGSGMNEFLVPDWRYAQWVPAVFSSVSLSFPINPAIFYGAATDKAIAWRSNREHFDFTISTYVSPTVTADSGPTSAFDGFWFIPLVLCIPDNPLTIRHGTGNHNDVSVSFRSRVFKDLTGYAPAYPFFKSWEVITDRDLLVGTHDSQILKFTTGVDNLSGKISLEEVYDHVDLSSTVTAVTYNQADLLALEGWIQKRYGRVTPFWKPSWRNDFDIQSVALAGTATITVQATGIATDYTEKYVCISYTNGEFDFREIAAAVVTGDNVALTLDSPLTYDAGPTTVKTISEMNLFRLDSDDADLRITQGMRAQVNIPLMEVDSTPVAFGEVLEVYVQSAYVVVGTPSDQPVVFQQSAYALIEP